MTSCSRRVQYFASVAFLFIPSRRICSIKAFNFTETNFFIHSAIFSLIVEQFQKGSNHLLTFALHGISKVDSKFAQPAIFSAPIYRTFFVFRSSKLCEHGEGQGHQLNFGKIFHNLQGIIIQLSALLQYYSLVIDRRDSMKNQI